MTALEIVLLILLIVAASAAFWFWRMAQAWRAEAMKWHAANRQKASAAVATLAAVAGLLILRRMCLSGDAEPVPFVEGSE